MAQKSFLGSEAIYWTLGNHALEHLFNEGGFILTFRIAIGRKKHIFNDLHIFPEGQHFFIQFSYKSLSSHE